MKAIKLFILFLALALVPATIALAGQDASSQGVDAKWNEGNLKVLELIRQKDFDGALKENEALIKYLEANKLTGGNEAATTYNNQGMICMFMGNFGQANTYLGKSLALRNELFGANSVESATTLLNLSHLYKQMAQYIFSLHKKAEPGREAPAEKK